jgi:hypothetical protein
MNRDDRSRPTDLTCEIVVIGPTESFLKPGRTFMVEENGLSNPLGDRRP